MRKSKTTRHNTPGKGVYAMVLLPLLLLASQAVHAGDVEITFTATISNDGGITTDNIIGQFTLDDSILFGIDVGSVGGIITAGSFTSSLFGTETADPGSAFTFVSAANRPGYGVLTLIAEYGGGFFALDLASDTWFPTANAFDVLQPGLLLGSLRAFQPAEALGTTRFVNFIGFSDEWEGALTSLVITNNVAPIADDQDVDTDEDIDLNITLTATDNDGPQALSFSVVSGPLHGSLSGTAPNLTYEPNADYNGADSFTFKANDGDLDSNTATVAITVNPVNDEPSFTANNPPAVFEDAGAQSESVASGFVPGPATATDEAGQTIASYIVTGVVNGGLLSAGPSVDATGTLAYTPAANANGSVTFNLQVQDNGGIANGGDDTSATQSVTITITPVNDQPTVASPIADVEVDEDALDTVLELSAVFADVDIATNGQTLTLAVTGNDNTGLLSATLLGTTLTLDYLADQNGSATIEVTATDSHDPSLSVSDSFLVTVNPINDAPTVSANNDSAQYSDPVLVTISGEDIDSTNLSITTTALPAGLSLSAACTDSTAPLDCEWTVSGNVTAAPGIYSVDVTVTDNGELTDTTALSAETSFEITVEQEDARSTYTGPLFLSSDEDGDFEVTLMATIRDITALGVGGDPAYDEYEGVITNASVRFEDETGALLCADSTVTLVFAGNEQVGSASCDYSGSLPNNADELPLEVNVVVGDHYIDDSDNEVVVLIVRPGEGKITGGGQLELANSAGVYAADPNERTNYGFNVQADKKGKKNVQVKGRVTIIVRGADGHKYKIKSNAMTSLGIDLLDDPDNEPYYGEAETKANLTDVTDPLNPVSLGGGLTLQLRMHDNGEPGEIDTISFTLWDGGTLLFSTNWDGAQSVEETIERGNLQVHP